MGKYFKDIDRGWNKIVRNIKALKKSSVDIGVFSDSGTYPKKKGAANLADVATFNEFGHVARGGKFFVLPRPFMRQSFDNNVNKIIDRIRRLQSDVYYDKIDARMALKRLGVYFVGVVKSTFESGDFAPLAPSTIKKKGSTKPLIDTGRLRNSIDYKVNIKL